MKKGFIWFLAFLIIAVIIFFVVSLVMANIHDVSMIEEWQKWFPFLKETKKVVETTASV